MSTLAPAAPPALDLRTLAPRDRHALVFARLDALQPGQSFEVLNDHDPQALRDQLDNRTPGLFEWTRLESGPVVWRVKITRSSVQPVAMAAGSCCSGGACCG